MCSCFVNFVTSDGRGAEGVRGDCGFDSADEMRASRDEALDYFVNEYRQMLGQNFDEYIANFESYLRPPDKNG